MKKSFISLFAFSLAMFSLVGCNNSETPSAPSDKPVEHVHRAGTPVNENVVEPTCVEDGSHDSVVYCIDDHYEMSRTHVVDPAIGHDFSNVSYEWASDHSSCDATAICSHDESHVINESVSSTYQVIDEPTYEAPGLGRYSVSFLSDCFTNQHFDVVIDKKTRFNFELNDDNESYKLTSFLDLTYSGELLIPATYNDLPVTAIGDQAFNGCNKITSVIIPENVERVGYNVFIGCDHLYQLTLPSTLTSYENGFFSSPKRLVEIIDHSSLDRSSSTEYGNCILSTFINVVTEASQSRLEITDNGFVYCNNGGPIFLIDYIGTNENINIATSVTVIREYAFYENTVVKMIVVPANVSVIQGYAFEECLAETIVLATTFKTIYGYVFSDLPKLRTITIPDSVETIKTYAFYNCKSLYRVTIGSNVDTIEGNAFFNCFKIASVINKSSYSLSPGVTSGHHLTDNALEVVKSTSESSLVTENGFSSIEYGGKRYLVNYHGSERNITIPNNIFIIHKYCFYYNDEVDKVTLSNNVSYIQEGAFWGCGLTEFDFAANTSVTSIPKHCFRECPKLAEIEFSKDVSELNELIFYEAPLLKVVTLNAKPTINGSPFAYCYNYELRYKASLDTWINLAKKSFIVNNASFVRIYDSITHNEIKNLDLSEYSFTALNEDEFNRCANIETVKLPVSCSLIGTNAFRDCISLYQVQLSSGVKTINNGAFQNCHRLCELITNGCTMTFNKGSQDKGWIACYILESPVASIDYSRLSYSVYGFVKYTYDNGSISLVSYIGTFENVTLPSDAYRVSDYAFYQNKTMKNVTIPTSITRIGEYSFGDMPNIESFTYEGTMEEWHSVTKADWGSSFAYLDISAITCSDGSASL